MITNCFLNCSLNMYMYMYKMFDVDVLIKANHNHLLMKKMVLMRQCNISVSNDKCCIISLNVFIALMKKIRMLGKVSHLICFSNSFELIE